MGQFKYPLAGLSSLAGQAGGGGASVVAGWKQSVFSDFNTGNTFRGCAVSSDGSFLYTINTDNSEIIQYQMSTPHDLSTASENATASLSGSYPQNSGTGLFLNSSEDALYHAGNDGNNDLMLTKYLFDNGSNDIGSITKSEFYQSNLSTQIGSSIVVNDAEDAVIGVDGLKITRGSMSTPGDITTLTFDEEVSNPYSLNVSYINIFRDGSYVLYANDNLGSAAIIKDISFSDLSGVTAKTDVFALGFGDTLFDAQIANEQKIIYLVRGNRGQIENRERITNTGGVF
jgi:hypothetical protein